MYKNERSEREKCKNTWPTSTATRMACASPADHAHEASTQPKERHKYNSPIHVRTKVECAQSLSEYRTRGTGSCEHCRAWDAEAAEY